MTQVRREAINFDEAEQKKFCEGEWARKAEEHAQLKEELEASCSCAFHGSHEVDLRWHSTRPRQVFGSRLITMQRLTPRASPKLRSCA